MLTHLGAVRTAISDVQGSLGEVQRRLVTLESGQASIIRHLGILKTANAERQLATNSLTEQLVRIECRLELRGD